MRLCVCYPIDSELFPCDRDYRSVLPQNCQPRRKKAPQAVLNQGEQHKHLASIRSQTWSLQTFDSVSIIQSVGSNAGLTGHHKHLA